ncbi:FixH family protein [Photobacterium sp. J15]|uniref:FixH family protein n=1 Tax=Photobacterium sp. J15 TaxID=265901 RepID=UPI000B172F36|nr:FixH family protein [Photobacterium sp. J15]
MISTSKGVSSLFIFLIPLLSEASTQFPVTVQHASYTITAEPAEKPIVLNKIHQWFVSINDTNGTPVQGLRFDVKGGMPEHRHGLPTKPKLISEGQPGQYIIDGVKFNMTGKWLLELIDSDTPITYRIEFELDHANSQ